MSKEPLKTLKIRKKTHTRLKAYCKPRGFVMHLYADNVLNQAMDMPHLNQPKEKE